MIRTTHLFPILDKKLLELLKSLSPDEWNLPTIAKLWTVKDIATHLLDGNFRTLSLSRDKHTIQPDRDINSYDSLVAYLNHLNADWVKATKRLSPQVLIDLLEITGEQYSSYLPTLDPNADALFSVGWAGEETSRNWFHIAREYTEKWHHQQQIREATGKQGILTKELFYPFIETFMYGLPHTYRDVAADAGTTIEITIDTEIGGSWYLLCNKNKWVLYSTTTNAVDAALVIQPDTAWKLFTKGITPAVAMNNSSFSGKIELAKVALNLVAVMA